MLSKFPNGTLKAGAVVSLSPEHRWARVDSNPVGVRGVVEEDRSVFGNIKVTWDNGTGNTHNPDAYDLIAEGEPGYLEV